MAIQRDTTTTKTVEVAVFYTTFDIDPETEAFETARDLRHSPDPEILTPSVFQRTYEAAGSGEITPNGNETREVLDEIYARLQGGRRDESLGYDGSKQRSAMQGDIIAVDEHAYLVGSGYSFHDIGQLADLRGGHGGEVTDV